ncbi:MAG: hypothetical protein V3T64_09770 [Myxococcota bacterium]
MSPISSIVKYDQRKRHIRNKMNDRFRNRPTTTNVGSHTGASNVTSTHPMKYAVMVIILRRAEDVDTE